MCSGVPRKRVRGDMITRFGKWISPIWIGSNKEIMRMSPSRSNFCWVDFVRHLKAEQQFLDLCKVYRD